ncbi:MAG: PolC-type DNA polymerase III [Firmicutes bacterium]|nr:PolC-type DNA polymerase III [Bacillota bacterium]
MQNVALNNRFAEIFPETSDREKIKNLFSEVEVRNINFYKRSKILEIIILSKKLIPAQVLAEIEEKFTDYFNLDSVNIKVKYNISKPLDDLIEDYWESIVFNVSRKIATSRGLLSGCRWKLTGKNLTVHLKTKGAEILKVQGCNKYIEEIIEEAFSAKIKVEFEDCVIDESYKIKYLENKKYEEAKVLKNIAILSPKAKESRNGEGKTDNKNQTGLIIGKNFNDDLMRIRSINQDSGIVAFSGDIMKVEFKEIKGNRYLCIFDITDYTSSLTVKFFVRKNNIDEIKKKIKEGITVKVRGEAQYDKFSREFVIIALDILQIEKQMRMDMAKEKRVELHLHTQMSAMDGVSPVEELIKRAFEWGHKAIAITDHGVVQAYPGASMAANKYNIKVIYGIECYLMDDVCQNFGDNTDYTKADSYHAIILVVNTKGLKNLYKLVSLSHLEYFYKKPRIPKGIFTQYREGLLLGTACEAGELYRAFLENKNEDEIVEIASFYDYFEIQPLGNNQFLVNDRIVNSIEDLKEINRKIVQLGEKLGKPVVATCDVHFLDPEDEVFRRILMAGQGYNDADKQAPLFFRTTEEMMEEFMYLGEEKAYEIVVTNTNTISNVVEKISPIPKGTFPPKIEGAEEEIEKLAVGQAKGKYGESLPEIVENRMKKELSSIIKNGFSVMYLIARNLVQKSLSNGYLVGSRGSVGSSFVAYLTGITEVNPLQPHYICDKCKYSEFVTDGSFDCGYDLPDKKCPGCGENLRKDGYDIPFETFLGFEGDKEPDIDLNFSGEYQARAHKFVEELFGEDHVFRAGTIASIAEKTAFGFVKNYLDERGIVVTSAEMNRLIRGCTGVKRTTGQHPGGIMIVPQDKEIYDFSPIQRPADDIDSQTITTHFDYDFLHGSILKLDILGHDDPTTIKMLEDLTGVDPRSIPIGDPVTMAIFSSTDPLGVKPEDINSEVGTLAIPEFGTKFVRQMLVETKPKTMSELIRISGLSHGTDVWINNAQDLIKSGTATLSEVICTRDDIMLYLIYSGLPPIKAFKIMEDVRKGKGLTEEYEEIMRQHNVPQWYIESCKKIKYMFPKAHAAAYVMMAFRIAWFKVHYPVEFYAVYFTVKADEFDAGIMTQDKTKIRNKILELESKGNNITQKEKGILTLLEVVNEMYARNIKFLPVDLYKSEVRKFIIEEGSIRPPLNSLPGLGVTAAQNIVEARKEGRFTSVEDLRIRGKASKTVIDILKEHGCLKNLPESSQISLF